MCDEAEREKIENNSSGEDTDIDNDNDVLNKEKENDVKYIQQSPPGEETKNRGEKVGWFQKNFMLIIYIFLPLLILIVSRIYGDKKNPVQINENIIIQ